MEREDDGIDSFSNLKDEGETRDVEKIVEQRQKEKGKGKKKKLITEYQVLWTTGEYTWEPENNLTELDCFRQFKMKSSSKSKDGATSAALAMFS